ncbi:hypothetical protein GH714_007337 [Hevea brasiliensis]|uniref:Uncharacterized protein n=1 Tax=Hevea brasiliensis TaxID=3981 RepID=A0A6A6KZW8_HEVBR|nr:hypothetical protein GH714_007337 [Hevea brasiliensis]
MEMEGRRHSNKVESKSSVVFGDQETTIDWRGRPSNPIKHGGMRAATFVLGSGCVKPNMIAHGADQFNQNSPKQSKKLSTYFNVAYFAFSMGELIALLFLCGSKHILAWMLGSESLQLLWQWDSSAWFLVFVAAISKRKLICPSNPDMLNGSQNNNVPKNNMVGISSDSGKLVHTQRFRFLDKACIKIQDGSNTKESPWRLCTVTQVEQVKILISVIPIFACTIVFNTILAQLQTFQSNKGVPWTPILQNPSRSLPLHFNPSLTLSL